MRFGFGIACGYFALVLIIAVHDRGLRGEELCCPFLGVGIWIALCCGALRFSLFIRELIERRPLCERHPFLSFASGAAYFALLVLLGLFLDELGGRSLKGWWLLLTACGYPVACAWLIFRRAVV